LTVAASRERPAATSRAVVESSRDAARDVGYICFSAQDWWYHNRAHSDFQLMRGVAKERNVLFVNSMTMRMPLPGRSTQPFKRILRKAHSISKFLRRPIPELPRFAVFTPILVPIYGNRFVRALNAAFVRLQVRICTRVLGFRETIYVVTIPTSWDVVKNLPRKALLYNRSDRHSAFPEADVSLIQSLERALLASSDRILYVSHHLMEEEAPATGDRGYFLDHGVDLEHFRHRGDDEPEDIRAIPHPRIGFFGALDDYTVDFELLQKVAREIPDAQLVLVGRATCSMAELERLPNVHWLGFKSYEEIPRYGSAFDVGLMPWLDNQWIQSSNPIKMKEYLALGLPIVSTRFPEVERYREVIEIGDNADDFVLEVKKTLQRGWRVGSEERVAAVADADWSRRARQLIELAETPACMKGE
jgi:glycosyltransferase involved in cell wall biosynthesis